MTLQTIGVGSSANDGNGDDLRAAMVKVNDNFIEAYGTTGTWTPVLEGEGTAGTFTYNTQAGTYSYLGPVVILEVDIDISAETVAAVGDMKITGLPVAATAIGGAFMASLWKGINFGAGLTFLGGRVAASGSEILLWASGDNVNNTRLDASEVGVVIKIKGVFIYRRAL